MGAGAAGAVDVAVTASPTADHPWPRDPGAQLSGPKVSMRRDSFFRRSLVLADAAAVALALVMAVKLQDYATGRLLVCIAGVPLVIVGAKVLGLYDRDETLLRKTTLDEVPKLFQVATLSALLAWVVYGILGYGQLGRGPVVVLWLSLFALLVVARAAARAITLRVAPAERCVFFGSAAAERVIRSRMINHGGVRAQIVARPDSDTVQLWSSEGSSEERLEEVRGLAERLDIHRAIVAPSGGEAEGMLDLVRTLKAVGVRVSVLPQMLQVIGSSVEFDDLHGVTLMGVRRFELSRSSELVKRAFDLVGASIALVLLAPVMALIAIAIKLDSRGPVFFRQLRVGCKGRPFRLIKFRTMVPDAEERKQALRDRNEAQEGLFKIAHDPRVTRVGRLLRATALDELPQLVNVLRGEMSLVGPRPLVVDEDEQVGGWFRRRLELHPGITGPWQILGPASVPLREMVAIDYLYVANWSLWNDVKIILRTVPHVLGRRGL